MRGKVWIGGDTMADTRITPAHAGKSKKDVDFYRRL